MALDWVLTSEAVSGMTLREDYRVPSAEAHRRLRVDLHEALAFRDEMENHDPLGTGLEQRRRRICAR
jgi:hypothetical protein